jgi:preprotein translocase SecE subunit
MYLNKLMPKSKGAGVANSDNGGTKGKRRLRAPVETVRQRQTSAASKAEQPKKSAFGYIWRGFTLPVRKLAGLSVWQAKWLKPVRFIFRWLGLIAWPPYFRHSFRELKLVTWPDFRQSWRLTFAVLAFAAVFGAAIAGLDFGLDKLFKEVLLK